MNRNLLFYICIILSFYTLPIFSVSASSQLLSDSLYIQATDEYHSGNLNRAIKLFKDVLEFDSAHYPDDDELISIDSHWVSHCYYKLGDIDSSKRYEYNFYELEPVNRISYNTAMNYSRSVYNAATIDMAIYWSEKCLSEEISLFGPNHYSLFGTYCSIAQLYLQNNNYTECSKYLSFAKDLSGRISVSTSSWKALPYIIQASMEYALQNEKGFNESLNMADELFGNDFEANPIGYAEFIGMYLSYNLSNNNFIVTNKRVNAICEKLGRTESDDISNFAGLLKTINDYCISTNQPSICLDLNSKLLSRLQNTEAYPFILADVGTLNKLSGNSQDAVSYLSQSLDILKSKYTDPAQWVDVLFRLGEAYDTNHNYDESFNCFKECNKICKKDDNLAVIRLQSLHRLAAISSRTNNYKDAINYLNDCLRHLDRLNISEPLDYAFIYKELGICYNKIDTEKSKEWHNKVVGLFETNSIDKNNETYITSYIALMSLEKYDTQEYEIKINKLLSDVKSSEYDYPVNLIYIYRVAAEYFSSKHNYSKALAYIDNAIELMADIPDYDGLESHSMKCILEVLTGNEDNAWAYTDELYRQTKIKYGQNSMQHARSICLYYILTNNTLSLERMEKLPVYGDELMQYAETLKHSDPEYFMLSLSAAKMYFYFNPLRSKEILEDMAANITNTHRQFNQENITDLYSCLNTLYRNLGDYESAVRYCNLILNDIGSIPFVSAQLNIYNEIGQTYMVCNKFRDAEKIFLHAISMAENLNEDCEELYSLYQNLANLYNKMGQTDLANDYSLKSNPHAHRYSDNEAFEMNNKLKGIWINYDLGLKDECFNDIESIEKFLQNPTYSFVFDRSLAKRLKAQFYYKEGDYDIASTFIKEAVSISQNIENMYSASNIFLAKGDFQNAAHYSDATLKIIKSNPGTSLMDYVPVYKQMGDIYLYNNQLDTSLVCYRKCFDSSVDFISQNILTLTSRQRADFWNSNSYFYHSYLPMIAYTHDYGREINGLLYDASLFSNGLLLSADQSISAIVKKGGNELRQLFNEYVGHKMILTQMNDEHNALWTDLKNPTTEELEKYFASEDRLKEYRLVCDAKERKLMDMLHSQYSNLLSYKTYTWKDIKKKLSKTKIAIEFIDFPIETNTNAIGALVVRANDDYPEFRVLYKYMRDKDFTVNDVYTTTLLGDSIIGNLSDLLTDCKDIYYATQGLLSTISLTDLPLSNPQLVANVNFHRLSSTRVLVEKKAKRADMSATLFGGLNYDTSVDSLILDAEKYPELKERTLDFEQFNRAKREGQGGIPLLPGTLAEVENISKLLISKGGAPTVKTWNEGTESAFKSLSGRYGSILHISTHGFFDSENIINNPNTNVLDYEDLAMEQSGLLLTGATNRYIDETEFPTYVNDGVLKASEIAKLDMQHVDIAVLSACETGLGALTSDGVMGLQRGFKKAGVNSLLMSLWKVDDEATKVLMEIFYKNWLYENKSKEEALRIAKATVKSMPQWAHPKYWAGFILLDAI